MKIIETSKKIENIIKKYDLNDLSESYKIEFAIAKTEQLQKTIEEINKESRKLKIGIVGRVKAGKSSLLNSLVFDGENILPKAATPMTAALTVLEYGESLSAEIEFFTQNDINNLKEKYYEYKKRYDKIFEEKLKELKEKAKRKGKNVSEEELKENAKKGAKRELDNFENLKASYEQYEKIKKSNVNLNELKSNINASTLNELNEKLKEYVGANGKYMPFTKSVTLKLNNNSLKDIQIIDTPGINDPVVSREERTRELLKYCDVVFIISPSGQFLSEEDLVLFDRITSKEGIKEVYLIASQIDGQLYGSEKSNDLYESLSLISEKLSNHAKSVFEKDEFLRNSAVYEYIKKHDVITSSAIAYSIYKKFDEPEKLDENEKHTFNLLKSHYEDYFTDINAKENLYKLSNIETIKKLLDDVKNKKEKILKEKLENFEKNKFKNLLEFKKAIEEEIKKRIEKIQNSNIKEIKDKIEKLKKIEKEAGSAVNEEFRDLIEELEINLKSNLQKRLNSFFSSANEKFIESESQVTEVRKIEKDGVLSWVARKLWGGGYEKEIVNITTVRAGIVRNALEDLTYNIETTIYKEAKEYLKKWREKDIFKNLIKVLRDKAGDENLEILIISSTLKKVIYSVKLPDIDYSGNLPSSLKKSGTLKGYEGEEFLEEAYNYMYNLRNRVKKDIQNYINELITLLSSINIADNIFNSYHKEIETLENEIKNKELNIERYNIILNELNKIKE